MAKVASETVRDETSDCNVSPCEPWAAVEGALIALPISGAEVGRDMLVPDEQGAMKQ